ncbi:MAG: hypothetical protein AUG51_14845 [Acidobacteria bacterium 13_1_20CM_3_53_8]|nr:MAG: hypothetical protein AUG51_14845 [Acidobacteria bacterium 13_1_20CM_3_53_8]
MAPRLLVLRTVKSFARRARLYLLACALTAIAIAVLCFTPSSGAVFGSLVISQFYSHGNTGSSTFNTDYVELANLSKTAIDVSNFSVQYIDSSGNVRVITFNSGTTIQPGTFYLIQVGQAGGNGGPIIAPGSPVGQQGPDQVFDIGQATEDLANPTGVTGNKGLIALFGSTTPRDLINCDLSGAVDYVGYGSAQTCFEGIGAAPEGDKNHSSSRVLAPNGPIDTDYNFADFTATITPSTPPTPHNSNSSGFTPTIASGVISGTILTGDGTPVAGASVRLSGSASALTVTDSLGRYSFEGVNPSGFYLVMPSKANYNFNPANRAFSQLGSITEAAFTGEAQPETANPLDTPEYFVRQQYLDFLGREPDAGGLAYWTAQFEACGTNGGCIRQRRLDVSAAFFQSDEFQQTGSFLYRLYKASYSVMPTQEQFTQDRSRVVDGDNLESRKAAFVEEWVKRDSFKQSYPDSLSAEEFVSRLMNAAGYPPRTGEWEAYILMLNHGGTRAQVLTSLINDAGFREREYNSSFVLMQYFGYLRRDADSGGYQFWLDVLNNRVMGNYRSMVCAFLTSTEYQRRFSSVVPHSNSECGQ